MQRIEICGGIASGKTSLCRILSQHFKMTASYEQFSSNPFLKMFYKDPERFAFETEISLTLLHYHHVKSLGEACEIAVCDYSFVLDKAFARVTLDAPQRRTFQSVLNRINQELKAPIMIIYLKCPVDIQLERIKRRSRDMERGISVQYLQAVNNALAKSINKINGAVRVLSIDAQAINYVQSDVDKKAVINNVSARLSNTNTIEYRSP